MHHAYDIDLPSALGFGTIFFVVAIILIWKALTSEQAFVALIGSLGILAVIFCLGAAMQKATLPGLDGPSFARAVESMAFSFQRSVEVSIGWIAIVAICAAAAYAAVKISPLFPKEAFRPVALALIAAGAFVVCSRWARLENLIVFAAVAVVVALCAVIAFLTRTISRRDDREIEMRRMEMLLRSGADPYKRLPPEHRGDLITRDNPFADLKRLPPPKGE